VLCLPGDPPAALAALALVGGALLAGLLGRTMPALRAVVAADAFPAPAGPGVGVAPARYDGWGVVPVPGALLHGLPDAEVLAVVPSGGAGRGDVLDALPL
jgi:molybdopterin molybdotransferase